MNTTSTRNQPRSRGQQSGARRSQKQTLSIDSIRSRIEGHVNENPMKAVGQAVALGYVLRFLPIRGILSAGLRLAAPIYLISRVLQSQQSEPTEE
jgi:hypothetical protein